MRLSSAKKKQQQEEEDSPSTISLSSYPKISLPTSLNTFFAPSIESIKDCLLFLERFSEDDEAIAKLLKVYNEDPEFAKNKDELDLDSLAKKAEMSRGEFRRLMLTTLDYLQDEEALMLLRRFKPVIVKKALEVALTDTHPDSYPERKSLLQYYGLSPVPKGAQVSINIDKSQNLGVVQQNQFGLPSFSAAIVDSEKSVSSTMKGLLEEKEALHLPSKTVDYEITPLSPTLENSTENSQLDEEDSEEDDE